MTAHLRRVGEIASLWSQLELHLDMLIWELLGVRQPAAACVTSQLASANSRLRAIKALIDLYGASDDIKRTINKFSENVEALQIKRNRAVHDAWQTGIKSRRVYQLRVAVKGNKLLFENEPISVHTLDRTIAQIRRVFMQAYRFKERLPALLVPSLGKSGPRPFARIETSPLSPRHRGKVPRKRLAPPKS